MQMSMPLMMLVRKGSVVRSEDGYGVYSPKRNLRERVDRSRLLVLDNRMSFQHSLTTRS